MYSNNDPHGWEIRDREGRTLEKGFPSYAKAAAKIREVRAIINEETREGRIGISRLPANGLIGVMFPVRSR